jgi:hypothetical protein
MDKPEHWQHSEKPKGIQIGYVASCSGLSIFDCPFGFLSMLPVALVCPFFIASFVFSLSCQKGQSKMDKSEQLAT